MTKVLFELEQNEDGFPPISFELINATPIKEGLFKIENPPFFTPNISYHDVVKASPTALPGRYQFQEVVEQSQFTALSIIIMEEGMDSFLMDFFRGLDCVLEYGEFGVYRVLAVAIPGAVDYDAVRAKLEDLEDRERISFAELAVPS